jgi:uncharacterized protein
VHRTPQATEVAGPFRPGILGMDEQGAWRLLASRCAGCGSHYFPRRRVCARCLNDSMDDALLSTRGTLYTYTVVRQSTPTFPSPYVLGYVDLPEKVRVLGRFADCEPEQGRIGMPVEISVEPVDEDAQGRPLLGYHLRPAPRTPGGER